MDLLSSIDGSAMDFKLIMSYLPAYLPQFTKHHIIMGGVSLGGHIAWRMPSYVSNQIEAMVMVVGCPNLSGLLLSRLKLDSALLGITATELYKVSYDELTKIMNETQKKRWPRRLHEIVSEGDRLVEESFPDLPLLLMGGREDPLVPVKFTEPWVEERKRNDKIEFFVQNNTGHSCTKEMVWKMAEWLVNLFADK
jgi:pimeloyl-ACP methyl ester carboxylesterase